MSCRVLCGGGRRTPPKGLTGLSHNVQWNDVDSQAECYSTDVQGDRGRDIMSKNLPFVVSFNSHLHHSPKGLPPSPPSRPRHTRLGPVVCGPSRVVPLSPYVRSTVHDVHPNVGETHLWTRVDWFVRIREPFRYSGQLLRKVGRNYHKEG